MTTDTETPVNADPLDGEESPAPASEDRRIYIDPDNLHAEVARLYQEHPDFRQAASTVIGTRAKREADARIRELEARLEEMNLSQKRRQFESMDEDEFAAAIRNPTVAAEYAAVMEKKAPDTSQIRSTNAVNLAVEEALDDLRAIGAPESRIDQWKTYLRDQNTPIDRSSPAAFIRAVQKAVDLEVHTPAEQRFEKYGYGKPPAPKAETEDEEQASETQPVAANPRLARGAPVRSQPDGGGKRRRYSTYAEAAAIRQSEGAAAMPTSELAWARANLPFQ